jgi:hypothetical protein
MDVLVQRSIETLSREHIDNEKLDKHLTEPESLAETERTAITLHLEMCDECRSVNEILLKCNEEIAGGLWEDKSIRFLSGPRIAAAALVLVGVLSAAIYFWGARGVDTVQTRSPGSEIRLVSPHNEQELAQPYVFRWEPHENAVRYEIVIKDMERLDESIVQAGNLQEPVYQLTDSELLELEPGHMYQWEVLAITNSGATVSSSIRAFKAPSR